MLIMMKYDYTRKRPAAHVPRNAHSRSHKACNRLKKNGFLPPPQSITERLRSREKGLPKERVCKGESKCHYSTIRVWGDKGTHYSITRKEKWGKMCLETQFSAQRLSWEWYFQRMGISQLDIKTHKQASIAEESSRGFSTGIYLLFRDAMGVGKIM